MKKEAQGVVLSKQDDLTTLIRKCLTARRGKIQNPFFVVVASHHGKKYLYPVFGVRSHEQAEFRAWQRHVLQNRGAILRSYTFGMCLRKHCCCIGRYVRAVLNSKNGCFRFHRPLSPGSESAALQYLENFMKHSFGRIVKSCKTSGKGEILR